MIKFNLNEDQNVSPVTLESYLISAIYDAAMDDALWMLALDCIKQQINANGFWLFTPGYSPPPYSLELFAGHAYDDLWSLYTAHYWQHGVWTGKAKEKGLYRTGSLYQGDNSDSRPAVSN